jgi:hypothetical protein
MMGNHDVLQNFVLNVGLFEFLSKGHLVTELEKLIFE